MKYFSIALGLASAITCTQASSAPLTVEIPYVCPIGGEQFKQTERVAIYREGTMLDLKPYGSYDGLPPPAVCPKNGFVMYRKQFSDSELEKLKIFIASPEYAKLVETETPRYRAAKIAMFLQDTDVKIIDQLLAATWEARTSNEYIRYAEETLKFISSTLQKPGSVGSPISTSHELLAGELERRLSLFAESTTRFERLATDSRFQEGLFKDIVALQLKLSQEKNANPQKIPKKDK